MASFFKQLSQDMERVAQVVEEGTKFMMGESESFGAGEPSSATVGSGGDVQFDEDGDEMFEDMDDIGDAYGSPLEGMASSVMSDIMSHQVGPQTPKEHVQAFVAAITWNEPFIRCLLAFHVSVVVAAVILTRRGGMYGRMGFMTFLAIIVRLAEWLNSLAGRRWREFATQNYFDGRGVFMGIMVCAPLLTVCLVILLSLIREASNLLGDMKRIRAQAQERQKKKRDEKRGKKEEKRGKKDEKKRKKKD